MTHASDPGIAFDEELGAWIVDGHEEFLAVSRSTAFNIPKLTLPPELLVNVGKVDIDPVQEQSDYVLLYSVGADHRRRRRFLAGHFTRQAVDGRRESIRKTVRELLTEGQRAGRIDLTADITRPLLTRIMSDVVGIPPALRGEFDEWAHAVTNAGQLGVQGSPAEALHRVAESVNAITQLVRDLLGSPVDLPRGSILSYAAGRSSDAASLSVEELAANVRSIYSSGIETTEYLVASTAYMIFSSPSALRDLRAYPSRIEAVVRETLRFACPAVEIPVRRANRDVRIFNSLIREGDWVRLVALKAERDSRRFSCPDEFDHRRTDQSMPLTYGLGPHRCLGQHLATAIAEEVGRTLADPEYGAHMDTPFPGFRRRAALPVIWGPEWIHLALA